jgi:nicotinamide mononucleotide transporter
MNMEIWNYLSENLLEVAGTLVGLLYLWYEYKASIYVWLAGVVMPAIYIVIYYKAGLYADVGINVYYLLIAIYGYLVWKLGMRSAKKKHRGEELPITHIPPKYILRLFVIFSVTFFLIAHILIHYTDSNVPWMDSFTTSLSIVGMWLLARKFVEQWWVWFVVDVACVGLYIYKDLHMTAALYTLYAVISVFGYRKWLQMMKEEKMYV